MQAAKGMEAGEEKSKYMIQRAQYSAMAKCDRGTYQVTHSKCVT